MNKYTINWIGPVFAELGYCRHNRQMILALERQNVKINLMITDDPSKNTYYNFAVKRVNKNPPKHLINVFCTPAPSMYPTGGYSILFTTIESRDLHPVIIHRAKCFDEIWVPCEYNRRAFLRAGFKKTFVIHEGIDEKRWRALKVTLDNKFRFVCLADWSERKGVHELVKAFNIAFRNIQDVCLIFLTRKASNVGKSYTRRIKKEALDAANEVGGSLEKIEFFTETLTDSQIHHIFSYCDCFVLPTKGEAWCLPAEEAMATGLPCILPKVGGQREFANNKTGWLTSGTWKQMSKSDVEFYNGQYFYHPDIKDLVKKMQYAYDHKEECERKGVYASKLVKTKFNWDVAAKQAVKRITEIYAKGYDPRTKGVL